MKTKEISTVAVIGAGIMGEGIAHSFAQAGLNVQLIDLDKEILEKCLARIDANLHLFDEFGLLEDKPSSILSRIDIIPSKNILEETKGSDFVVEAVSEVMEIKKSIFSQLDLLPSDIILASNTSSLTITSLTEEMGSAERVVGLHYFNPAHIIPAVEVHTGELTSDTAVEIAYKLMLRVGKKPAIVRKSVPGFIVNRLTGAMEREIDYLIDEGIVSPEDLDTIVKASFGFRLACIGPMAAEDMIGLETSAKVSANIFKVLSNKTEPSPVLLKKVDKGELGIKSGKGWYDYSGKTREEIGDSINRRLLKQLVLFNSVEK